jgi:membrane associated rhomboid family serine protease
MRREYWHLTEGLIFVHFAVFLLSWANPQGLRGLALVPGATAARPWTLVTYQFIHGQSMFWFFISMLVLWIMAKPIEGSWGSPRFLVFWLVATFGAAAAALFLGRPLAGDTAFMGSLLFTYATLNPEMEFLLFFVLPVKVKWLAIIGGGFLVVSSFMSFGVAGGIVNVVGMSAGYLFFLATRRLPTRRKIAFELKKRRAQVEAASEVAEAEQRNRAWDPLVREAEQRAIAAGEVAEQDLPLLAELDGARDPGITVCAPSEFGFVDDDVCRSCPGFAECAARRIRMAADQSSVKDSA